MTVCVAAICEINRVVGVSDRMITAGDIEFEPPVRKVWIFTDYVLAMTAGDTTLQTEILRDVEIEISQRMAAEPSSYLHVRDVAELYRERYEEIRFNRAESGILAPLGLDRDSFITSQKNMDVSLVNKLIYDLTNYALPSVQTIFTGIDNDGPLIKGSTEPGLYAHIYVSNGGSVLCYDSIGFAAIGYGDWHAQSQFMFAKHWRARPMPETVFLAYSAKKHAEVAPGVGKETDMFLLGPAPTDCFTLGDNPISELERIYQQAQTKIVQATKEADEEFRKFVHGPPPISPSSPMPNPSGESSPQSSTDGSTDQPASPG